MRVYLSIGSNMGDRLGNLRKAGESIEALPGVTLEAAGRIYETAPLGGPEQEWFYNTAVAVETGAAPADLLRMTRKIEADMGRVRGVKWGPRVIDIDIIFYGNETVDTPELVIPHPMAAQRRFVLLPVADIDPGFVHPVLGKTVAALLESLPEKGQETRLVTA
ncbi:MAG: 2-amino-4-hydroxy-6-hydroxymethyldihydropteridine diphosphokinase [Nitrospinae bacterium]|nr:2-amino-4-hydroxy-6-hydroxymethyldihydropteridine diphosphokinase [Nitrospinota bacterium]